MPVYDYKCPEHGLFHELVAMDASGDTQPCPECGDLAPRVLLVSPPPRPPSVKSRSKSPPALTTSLQLPPPIESARCNRIISDIRNMQYKGFITVTHSCAKHETARQRIVLVCEV